MKNRILVFCAFILVTTTTVTAYNSRTGPARQTEGIVERNGHDKDSLMRRGKQILDGLQLNEADRNALSTYFNNH